MGFMVVGVGHVYSGEKNIEWRMSFTLQERMLMSILNPVQHKVYILLEILKKNILGNVLHEETLTSYHFKTCILYAVHMSPARAWKRDNLVNCLLWCLKLMVKWLETNVGPSYLIQYQNLFTKEGFSLLRIGVLIEMRRLIESGHQFLYMLQSDNIGDIFRNGDWRMYRDLTIYTKKLTRVLEKLKYAQHINNHSAEVTQSAMAFVFPWLHLHIANGLASFTHSFPNRAIRKRVMELVDFHLNEARGTDLVNGRLAAASVLFKFEKYEECSLLLYLIESDLTYNVIRDLHEKKKTIVGMSISHIFKSIVAGCVVFLPSAAVLAPEPLRYEMLRSLGTLPGSRDELRYYWFDWALVDAKVYLYFMQYLVNSKLHKDVHRDVARDNLRAEIDEDDQLVAAGQKSSLGHTDTAYNLLGWIYMQEERLVEAYVCFNASWKIRPYHNAAKYHTRDLMVRLAARRLQH